MATAGVHLGEVGVELEHPRSQGRVRSRPVPAAVFHALVALCRSLNLNGSSCLGAVSQRTEVLYLFSLLSATECFQNIESGNLLFWHLATILERGFRLILAVKIGF